jgi:hypothetical protein
MNSAMMLENPELHTGHCWRRLPGGLDECFGRRIIRPHTTGKSAPGCARRLPLFPRPAGSQQRSFSFRDALSSPLHLRLARGNSCSLKSDEIPDNGDNGRPNDGPDGHSDYDASGSRQIINRQRLRNFIRLCLGWIDAERSAAQHGNQVGILVVLTPGLRDPSVSRRAAAGGHPR